MFLEKNTKLLMIGDSITDSGRLRPVGDGIDGLGKGYVNVVNAMLQAVYGQLNIRIINMAIGGQTIIDLENRWDNDVIDMKPDWVSLMIGINDVWNQFMKPNMPETYVLPEQYQKTLEELIAKTKPIVKGIILMTPFFIEAQRDEAMRKRVDEYGKIVKEMAQKYDAILIDTQAAFDKVLENVHSAFIALDRVHPNAVGDMIIAKEFVKAVGFEWK